jgi:hypothetical protein
VCICMGHENAENTHPWPNGRHGDRRSNNWST